jgi:PIN domain nuclease of toxin-antitoxin system
MNSPGMNTLYVVHTHVLIWYFTGSKRLQKQLKEKIDAVRNLGGRLLVPTIVLAEALDIAEKERVAFNFEAMYQKIVGEPEFEIVGFSPEIFEEVVRLKNVKEIHEKGD